MKKIYTVFVALLFLGQTQAQPNSFLQKDSWSSVWNSEDEDSPSDPGWTQQYYEMKKDAAGKIPRLPFDKIRAHDAQGAPRDNLLFNVQELGPYNIGGRTRAILIDRANDSHLLVGSVSGGLFSSNDAGDHWSVVNDEMSALSISSLAQDHFNSKLIYAGTGEGWGNADGVIGNGVYRSEDGGVTFDQLPSTDNDNFNYIYDVATNPADSNSVYIATGTGNLYRSFNKGDSLQLVFNMFNAISDIEMTPTGGVWIAVYNQGIYYSASGDSGTFTTMNTGLPTGNMRRIEFAIAQSDTTILYAMVERASADGLAGVFRSNDYGQTWNALTNPTDYGFYTTFTWYSMCIAIKPDDPDYVMIGVGDLLYTHDGGQQWFPCFNIHPDHHAIVWHPENFSIIYEGNDGGIYRLHTETLGYTHDDLNDGYRTIQYYAGAFYPSGINSTGGSQDNGTHKCKAGDSTFFYIYGGDGAYCAVNQQFADVVYASSQNGSIARADDGTSDVPSFGSCMNQLDGNGDGTVDEGAWFINPFDINMVNGDYLAFVTLKRLWESFDGGSSWQPAMNQIAAAPFAIGISKDFNPTIYIGGSSAVFMRIDNAYDSQPGDEVNLSTTVPTPVTNDFISCITVHPNDNSICYISFSNFSNSSRVWKVTAANTDSPVWTDISGDLPQGLPVNYIDVDPARPDDFFLAATDYGVYVTNNGGVNWYKINELPNVFTEQVKVRLTDRRVFVYTHGRGSFTATLDSLEVGIPSAVQNNFAPVIFPNPCADAFTVKTDGSDFTVSVRNVGNQIVVPPTAVRTSETIDVSKLPAGVYLVEMNDGKETRMKKLIKD